MSEQEQIFGYKYLAWKNGLLQSPSYPDTNWSSGRNIKAVLASCEYIFRYPNWMGEQHAAPDEHCTCGLYMTKDVQELYNYMVTRVMTPGRYVVVKLAAWGNVIEGEFGWRSEYARVVAFVTSNLFDRENLGYISDFFLPPNDTAEKLAEVFNLPLEQHPDIDLGNYELTPYQRASLMISHWQAHWIAPAPKIYHSRPQMTQMPDNNADAGYRTTYNISVDNMGKLSEDIQKRLHDAAMRGSALDVSRFQGDPTEFSGFQKDDDEDKEK